jgi:hypothetical protein
MSSVVVGTGTCPSCKGETRRVEDARGETYFCPDCGYWRWEEADDAGGRQWRCYEVPQALRPYLVAEKVSPPPADWRAVGDDFRERYGFMDPKTGDPVNHPAHYKRGGMEAIDVIEAFDLGFQLGNAVKYILRAGHKGDALEDLKKARWYLDREIGRRGG